MKNKILSRIGTECPWRDTLYWFDTLDSTNDRAKEMADAGAPNGTVLIAGHQSKGRGRMGRSFHSADGLGLYMSVILRPDCDAPELMHLTCATAVAACQAINSATGYTPGIKWINDLVAERKKLGGILTELSLSSDGLVRYAVVGIGINCNHSPLDFPPELQKIATSLAQVCGKPILPEALCAALVTELAKMSPVLLTQKSAIMDNYRANCVTLGQQVVVHQGDITLSGIAREIRDDGALLVQYDNGTANWVNSGEVSVRGLFGYC